MSADPQNATRLLHAWTEGDAEAGNELFLLVYSELRRLAASYLRSERPDHTLQPTALVHELYLKLFPGEPIVWHDRGHFFAVAARQLRHLVVDYARRRHARKRGGTAEHLAVDQAARSIMVTDPRLLDLDVALDKLEQLDSRTARVVELRYFAGLTEAEIAAALSVSLATVKRDWEFGRSWLLKELGGMTGRPE